MKNPCDDPESRLAAIVASSDDAIVSKDLDGMITSWNRAAEEMFGFPAAEAIGSHISIIVPDDRLDEEAFVLAQVRSGAGIRHFETRRRRKDGSFLDIDLTVSPIRSADGVVIGASKVARDITEQKRLRLIADETSRMKDEFLAAFSHELRTRWRGWSTTSWSRRASSPASSSCRSSSSRRIGSSSRRSTHSSRRSTRRARPLCRRSSPGCTCGAIGIGSCR